ncbi:MAG: hypothetical protein DA408_07920 [Bacteroidetes bacterium]|nr:MAG: hypothetical protein C7N36_13625 [Bacteroidota bacterium]PTM13176.1 MAG: hypothetical protein DA408_07920 [Bacteroidota bacterium]
MAFNGRFVLNIADFAAKLGVNYQTLIQLSGHSVIELEEEACQVTDTAYNTVLEHAVLTTGDEYLGLHMGESLNLSAAGLIVQIVQNSQTVRQALEYCCQFANLGCSTLPLELKEEAVCYTLRLHPQSWLSKLWSA